MGVPAGTGFPTWIDWLDCVGMVGGITVPGRFELCVPGSVGVPGGAGIPAGFP